MRQPIGQCLRLRWRLAGERQEYAAQQQWEASMHQPDHSKWTLGVVGQMQPEFAAELAQRFPRLELVPASANDLDGLLVWQQQVDAIVAAIEANPRLRWVHLRWAGVPPPVVAALDGSDAALTNGS